MILLVATVSNVLMTGLCQVMSDESGCRMDYLGGDIAARAAPMQGDICKHMQHQAVTHGRASDANAGRFTLIYADQSGGDVMSGANAGRNMLIYTDQSGSDVAAWAAPMQAAIC